MTTKGLEDHEGRTRARMVAGMAPHRHVGDLRGAHGGIRPPYPWTFDSYGMDGAVPLLIGVFLIWPLFGIAIIGYSLGLIASVVSHMLMRRRRDRIDADE